MSPEEKIQDILSENVFGQLKKMVSNKKKSGSITDLGGGKYSIKGNKVDRIRGVSHEDIMGYDWDNDQLSWLADATWEAEEISLSITSTPHRVSGFVGNWYKSGFKGGTFYGEFHGNGFIGVFNSDDYSYYKAHPSTFINGKVWHHKEGVLGIKKLDEVTINSNSSQNYVSLLEIQVGHYVSIVGNDNNEYVFRVTKSIDDESSDFEIEQINGNNPKRFTLKWENIRRSDNRAEFDRLSRVIIGSTVDIPFLFDNDPIFVESISITSSNPVVNNSLVQDLNLRLLYPLDFTDQVQGMNPSTKVQLNDQKEVERFKRLNSSLENGAFSKHLRTIIDGIRLGFIEGYSGYPTLKWLFSGVEGSATNSDTHKASMAWLQEFMSLVPLKVIVKSPVAGGNYNPNNKLQNKILFKIKEQIDGVMPDQAQQPEQGGTAPPDKEVSQGVFEARKRIKKMLRTLV